MKTRAIGHGNPLNGRENPVKTVKAPNGHENHEKHEKCEKREIHNICNACEIPVVSVKWKSLCISIYITYIPRLFLIKPLGFSFAV